jgi:hypothetical protein
MKNTDRKSLIRLAATLPKGSDERKAILVGFQGGESHDGRQRQAYTREDGKEMDMDESAEHDPEAWDDYTDAMIGIEAGLKRLGFKVQGDAHGGDTEWDDGLHKWSTELDIQGPFGKARIEISGTVSKDRPGLERGAGFYTVIFRGGDWWDGKHLKHGEIEMDGGDPKRFVKKVLEVWADGGLNRTRKASSDRQALIRLASALPKGGNERRVLLAELQKESVYRKSDKAKKLDSRNGYDLWEDRNKWVITDRRGRVYLEPFGLRRDADKAWGMLK